MMLVMLRFEQNYANKEDETGQSDWQQQEEQTPSYNACGTGKRHADQPGMLERAAVTGLASM